MSTEANKQFIRDFFKAMSNGDGDALAAAYHPEGKLMTMGNTLISGTRGVEEIQQFAPAVLEAFPDKLAFQINNITAEGDFIAVEAESDGQHVSGAHYHNYYHFLFELRDGKVYRLKEYMDTEMVTDVLCGGQRPADS